MKSGVQTGAVLGSVLVISQCVAVAPSVARRTWGPFDDQRYLDAICAMFVGVMGTESEEQSVLALLRAAETEPSNEFPDVPSSITSAQVVQQAEPNPLGPTSSLEGPPPQQSPLPPSNQANSSRSQRRRQRRRSRH